jgi:alpha-tubulin suppressor-like RCC1 family protein
VDLTGGQNNLGGDGGDPNGGPTGLPENDDEILR